MIVTVEGDDDSGKVDIGWANKDMQRDLDFLGCSVTDIILYGLTLVVGLSC